MKKEAAAQKAILDYLSLKKHFCWRNNSGAFAPKHGGFLRFGLKGSPDILCCIDGQMVGIEVKAGTKQSDAQKDFQEKLEAAGGKYILAHNIDEVHAALQ